MNGQKVLSVALLMMIMSMLIFSGDAKSTPSSSPTNRRDDINENDFSEFDDPDDPQMSSSGGEGGSSGKSHADRRRPPVKFENEYKTAARKNEGAAATDPSKIGDKKDNQNSKSDESEASVESEQQDVSNTASNENEQRSQQQQSDSASSVPPSSSSSSSSAHHDEDSQSSASSSGSPNTANDDLDFADSEEFEGFSPSSPSENAQHNRKSAGSSHSSRDSAEFAASGSTQKKPPTLKISKVPDHLTSGTRWTAYWPEGLMLAGLAAYAAAFMIGRARNQSLANAWIRTHYDLLASQFALLGTGECPNASGSSGSGGSSVSVYTTTQSEASSGSTSYSSSENHSPNLVNGQSDGGGSFLSSFSSSMSGGGGAASNQNGVVPANLLQKQSEHCYWLWCSGRIGCESMLVTLRLAKRQDLVALLSSWLRPGGSAAGGGPASFLSSSTANGSSSSSSSSSTSNSWGGAASNSSGGDRIEIRVDLDEGAVDGWVGAICAKRRVATLLRDCTDIVQYCGADKKQLRELPDRFVIFSEIAEATTALCDSTLCKMFKDFEDRIEYIYVSDQHCPPKSNSDDQQQSSGTSSSGAATPPHTKPKQCLLASFKVGRLSAAAVAAAANSRKHQQQRGGDYATQAGAGMGDAAEAEMAHLVPLLKLVLYLVDKIGRIRLGKDSKLRSEKNRQRVQDSYERAVHSQRQEAAQQRREEKRRGEKERLLTEMDPDRARRLEKEDAKREAKRKQPKMKMLKVKGM